MPDFLQATKHIREDKSWKVDSIPQDLQNRHVEITGPVERKMMINALNSGANVFMADFEDANFPIWYNCIQGHINLRGAINQPLLLTARRKKYEFNEEIATLLVRLRGWHLYDRHIRVGGETVSASLMDFGLLFLSKCERFVRERLRAVFLPSQVGKPFGSASLERCF